MIEYAVFSSQVQSIKYHIVNTSETLLFAQQTAL